ncbi:MAG TPA: 3-hydroxyacyl-CoA dehydrogenase NAD-binding domain-containing protein [Phycisphaerae bacterium]|nr:3-hydroxyacyl-CoA dehydrogenase NAD-binding domain-containing protein [Phycisphaerae bacterium]
MSAIDKSKPVGVVGAGAMGRGIVQVFAQSGFDVLVHDANEAAIDSAIATIEKLLERSVSKERITAVEKDAALKRITPVNELSAFKPVQLFVEAASERPDIKKSIFKGVDDLLADDAIRASNTSSISITELAAVTKNPTLFIGMHFFNPVPVMKLVEIVMGLETSDATYDKVHALAEAVGKTPLRANDHPGFVSNRILMPMINEAILCLQDGVATPEAIDGIMQLGMAHPMGPLRLADLIGLDVCYDILNVLHRDLGEDKYSPAPLLRKMVLAGRLGNKTKRGFYEYE